MKPVDLLIIGGGPAGAACALGAKRLGIADITIVDKAPRGRLKPCAGGIAPAAEKWLRASRYWDAFAPEIYLINAARIVTGRRELVLAGDATSSVMHRADFDAKLLSLAESAGAVVRSDTRVRRLMISEGRVTGVEREGGGGLEARFTVVAAGATQSLVRDPRPSRPLTSCTAWYEGVAFTEGRLEMIFDPRLHPHYAWLFPEGPSRANIGLCVYPDRLNGRKVVDVFEDVLADQFGDRLKGARRVAGPLVHPIRPLRNFRDTAPPGALVCGEAAGLINAFTGEGITQALISGYAAGTAAARILDGSPDAEPTVRRAYTQEVRKATSAGLGMGRALCRFGPAVLSITAALASSPAIRRIMTRMLSKV